MKFGMWGTNGIGHLHSKNYSVCRSSMKLFTCENYINDLPVTEWHTGSFGRMHTTVCLDFSSVEHSVHVSGYSVAFFKNVETLAAMLL